MSVLPLITVVFGVQCYLMSKFSSNVEIGDLAIGLAGALVIFVCSLFYYDKNHVILIYSNHLKSGMMRGKGKRIEFFDIEEIVAPKEEKRFGTLVLKMKDGLSHTFYFVDYPVGAKAFLDEQIEKDLMQSESIAA
ncbi:MAG: hypothetical protein KC478_17345 [Bacteriovoracaceae bacterium]|nr:hypothetical protein [Bacteriovoracaceae bacterium]